MTVGESSPFEVGGAAVPETTMAGGSDDGEHDGHLAELPLRPDERELLDRLEQPAATVVHLVEDLGAAAAAAEDDSALPADGPGQVSDPLSPQFRQPPTA